jgi:putative FmdB family regulatory protein
MVDGSCFLANHLEARYNDLPAWYLPVPAVFLAKVKKSMPIYTYRCENCGVQFERQQKFTEPALTVCPECSQKTLRKVYTPVGIVFKGSGFYATDHRSPSGMSSSSKSQGDGEKKPSSDSSSESSPPAKSGEE